MLVSLTLALLLLPSALFPQTPSSFNYQAVARSNGEILKNTTLEVRLSLLQGSESGAAAWSETQTVTTNDLGLFTLQAGRVTPVEVDWSAGPYYLKVEVDLQDGNGFQAMGTAQVLPVPYALYARDVANKDDADADPQNEIQDLQLNGNLLSLTLKGDPTVIDLGNYIDDADADPQNEIQDLQLNGNILTITKNGAATEIDLSPYLDNPGWNRTGDTLTYPGSVGVGTETVNGSKLAVQGDDVSSSEALFEVKRKDGQPVFSVYNDSVVVHVNDAATKGPRGGFIISGFGPLKGDGQDYLRVTPDSVRIYINASDTKGPRGGFAIGGFGPLKGNNRDYFNVSGSSTADVIQSENRVAWYPRKNAFLAGRVLVESPDSVGTNSFATGYEARAKGNFSQAMGFKPQANGGYSTAIGRGAIANGLNSFALGQFAKANKDESYAFGRGALADGFRSFAFGSAGVDSAGTSTGVAHASGDYSFAIGQGAVAEGEGSFSMGLGAEASEDFSYSIGYKSKAIGGASLALGKYSEAKGYKSFAVGGGSASGDYSVAIGGGAVALSYKSIFIGTTIYGLNDPFSNASKTSWNETDPLFVVGNGHWETIPTIPPTHIWAPGIALTILKNGNVGINTTNPGQKLDVNGNIRLRGGDRLLEISDGFLDIRPHDETYGMILRNYKGTSTVWSSFRTVDATTDYLHISMNSTSTSEGIVISDNGNVGIGTSNPTEKLYVNGNIRINGNIRTTGDVGLGINPNGYKLYVYENAKYDGYAAYIRHDGNSYRCHGLRISAGNDYDSNGTTYMITFANGANDAKGTIKLINGTIQYTSNSDRRLKTNIVPTHYEGLKTIMNIPVVDFEFKSDPGFIHTGIIAQDVQKVFPYAVSGGENDFLSIDKSALVPMLIKAIQEQQQIIEAQGKEIARLKKEQQEVADLRERLEKMERLLNAMAGK